MPYRFAITAQQKKRKRKKKLKNLQNSFLIRKRQVHVALVVREFNELTNTSTDECILEGQDVKHNICVLCERAGTVI